MKANWWQTILTGLAMAVGYILLIPFCLAQSWETCESTYNPFGREPRPVDRWKWTPLNSVYGNPEDGVSGQQALVWNSTGTARVLYQSPFTQWAPWKAYCWSAWRNSTDQLKYPWGDT